MSIYPRIERLRLNSTATFSPTVSIDSKFLISIQISFQSLAFISYLAISGAKISLPDILLSNHSIIKQEIQEPDCPGNTFGRQKSTPEICKSEVSGVLPISLIFYILRLSFPSFAYPLNLSLIFSVFSDVLLRLPLLQLWQTIPGTIQLVWYLRSLLPPYR